MPTLTANWSALPLRLIVGYGFLAHGVAKLAKGPDRFVDIVHAIGVPAPHFMAWSTILVELLGGIAVLLGAFVPLVSVPMAAVLIVAALTVHLPYGFTSIKLMAVTAKGPEFGPPGYETDLLYLACLATLVFGGSGPWALDGLLVKRLPKAPWAFGPISSSRTAPAPRLGRMMLCAAPTLRVARPSDDLDAVLRFYRDGLGLALLDRFENHDGFNGIMLGGARAPYHFEFTQAHGHAAGRAPTQDNLLIFYVSELAAWQEAVRRMRDAGFAPVPAFNPYWDRDGVTFEDPDGYRVVLQRDSWGR
jgi:putative oxidoreductase